MIVAITFFMGALTFKYVETVNLISPPPSTLPVQPFNPDSQTDYQSANKLMQSAQAVPTIWINTDTTRSKISIETASEKVMPDYQLLEADPVLPDQTCSTDDLFPALPKSDNSSNVNPVRPWEYVTHLLTPSTDQKYYIPIISPLKNVDKYSLVDGSFDNDDRTVRPALGCNEQAMLVPSLITTAFSPLSIVLDHIYLQ
ncbi:MAG: hypothetical protein KDI79_12025 [Anaerolineae bacterium]|nr:hypothetical protein [Anaerolineae bacterium]